MYPSVPIMARECTQKFQIPQTDIVIEKGTSIFIPITDVYITMKNITMNQKDLSRNALMRILSERRHLLICHILRLAMDNEVALGCVYQKCKLNLSSFYCYRISSFISMLGIGKFTTPLDGIYLKVNSRSNRLRMRICD